MKKRVVFPVGKQKEFVKYFKEKINLPWAEISKKLSVNENTISKAYCFETCNIPLGVFEKIVLLCEEKPKAVLKKYQAKIIDEVTVIGRKVMGEQKKKLEEVNILFKNSNLELDNSKVSFSIIDRNKRIMIPSKMTPELAEEIGIHYGDGFLSSKRFTYRLKGNLKDEMPYYQNYIAPLFKKLYNADINLKQYRTTYGFELYSQAVCEFKVKVLGIKPGNKQYIEFPECLKVNNIEILTAFLRGLFDTDGCLYFKTNYGYKKYYPTITIELFSKKIIIAVSGILSMLGFKPGIYFRGNMGTIRLNGIGSLKRYEKLIGWSSPKNLNKVKEWKIQYPELNKENMANVF
jgi:intein/homing endonuclease